MNEIKTILNYIVETTKRLRMSWKMSTFVSQLEDITNV